jgi:LysR family cys regulon transcriptional activator
MKLDQLRLVLEIARQEYNVSRAAANLNAPQPVVSRQLKALERELGVEVFVRGRNRLRGLTAPGKQILEVARRVIADIDRIANVARDFHEAERGSLTVATTHTQARYVLPRVIRRFSQRYPDVDIMIRQGSPADIVDLVRNGQADVCIGSESAEGGDLLLLPCYTMHRIVLTPPEHPLLRVKRLTLEMLARYPIITYDAPSLGRLRLAESFAARGLTVNVILSAIDTDVIKAYVEEGLGIAIVAKLAFDPGRDTKLRAIDASRLFEPNTIHLGVRRHDYLRTYVLEFIHMFAPQHTPGRVIDRLGVSRRGRPGRL